VGEDTNQIERQIAEERSDLGRNLHELEHKAKALADWRTHYRNHTAAVLGVAFGGGLVLGVLTAARRNGSGSSESDDLQYGLPGTGSSQPGRVKTFAAAAGRSEVGQHVKHQVNDVWRMIVDALVGVGATKAVDLIGRNVPGFREHYERRTGSGTAGY